MKLPSHIVIERRFAALKNAIVWGIREYQAAKS